MGFDELVQHDLSEMTTGIGNGLTGGNGSPVGIADDGVGNAEMDNGDAFTLNGNLTLGQSTQNYKVTGRGDEVAIQGQNSGRNATVELYTKDGDGTDATGMRFYSVGTPSDISDRESVRLFYDSSQVDLRTTSSGTGTLDPIHIYTGSNTDQIVARTDGNVAMNNSLLVGTTGAATNALGVSGGMAVGSGFAGSNTAPTDGLLVEGGIAMSSNGAGLFVNSNGDVVAEDDSGNRNVLT